MIAVVVTPQGFEAFELLPDTRCRTHGGGFTYRLYSVPGATPHDAQDFPDIDAV